MNRNKDFIKRTICIFLVYLSVLSLLINGIEVKAGGYNGTTGTGVDVGGWSGADGTTTRPIMIPPFTVNGTTTFCCQLALDFPVNYAYPAPYETDNAIYKGIALIGFNGDVLGLKGKYGLSNLQTEQYTQYALWKLTGGTADRRNGYVDELIAKLQAHDYGAYSNISFNID